MATSRRRDIINFIIAQLKTIDGATSSYGYNFKTNLSQNVFKGLKYIDQINDFPSIYVQGGVETYSYNSKTNTQGSMEIMARVYTYEENSMYKLEDIIEDITHALERIKFTQNSRIISAEVSSIDSDSGLLDPYGLGEIRVLVIYDVDD
jgi:hypothetical protein